MNARELDHARALLQRRRIRAREGFASAAVCTVAAAGTAPFTLTIALALLVGAVVALLLAVLNVVERRETIARLALDPNAYSLSEVRGYGARLVAPAQRERLAGWLRELVRDASFPGNVYLSDRVSAYAHQLEFLASELAASWVSVRPDSAAVCLHLLTHAAESPLYNPALPPEDLASTLERIRRGIGT